MDQLSYVHAAHPSWHQCLAAALQHIDSNYITHLSKNKNWLPGPDKLFNAFSLPLQQVNYVLFGESPYPRQQSANGYAFWDAAVTDLWSTSGLSKPVNRATSLRNIIKTLLVADGMLSPTATGQTDIAKIKKNALIQTNQELFTHLLQHGFLLLNASPVLTEAKVKNDAKAWQPFIKHILLFLFKAKPNIQLILFGKIANQIDALVDHAEIKRLYAEHPYNLSFITNPEVIDFFKPLQLLRRNSIANRGQNS